MHFTKSFKNGTNKIVALGLLVALIVVLQALACTIHIGTLSITLALVPIVIGAIIYGPFAGAALGLIFGGIVTLYALVGLDAGTAGLIQVSPVWTIVLALFKGMLAGLGSGLVYKLFSKNRTLGCIIASISAPIFNTGTFCIAMLTVMRPALLSFAQGSNPIYFLFIVIVGVNFIVEFAINAVLSATIARIVQVITK
ncbi:MAG: ECF transporter S component [Clostridia bacterium]|nr:ECF transporter S component [Clostridia bacterium]